MLIREQGNVVKLIRVVRGQENLRGRQEIIDSFRPEIGPTTALLALLLDDERGSLERWLNARNQQQHRQTLGDALPRLVDLAAAIDAAAELLTPADARAIWHELEGVARALKRVGYPRPSRRPAKTSAVMPEQGDLLG
ncbi:hypothetical protein LBW62_07955 [Ralstonia solanacearum]|uniref:hypothetical protein n=1 Tax=Ralstonia solanacearum TaxID=305 RepID=UPI0006965951|nr:hypothetical protein [Ralstonia solanacearum]MBB6592710.1 hypothetical protein [Ralstonia solanacearum]MBB6596932.1 hypothetical protein [Ralstonia solanacearum]MDB0541176.1 hypothetical protein [Ralstonia solanacearum]MDB0551450.1 hypothetical protein [Ralstonia solanacearum]MDB0556125.1 hypothetical protein [Ralstonia solanacearum]